LPEGQQRLLDTYLMECKLTGMAVKSDKDQNLVEAQLGKEYEKQMEFLYVYICFELSSVCVI